MSCLSHSLASHFSHPASRFAFCLFFGGVASLSVFGALKAVEGALLSDRHQIIPSPSLRQFSKREVNALPYPPDALPGARDVDSPYGTFRVYEWGPEEGPKVLLIHGISTPSIALAGLAAKLVERGCRVMLFDLFGRGHSSGPSSTSIPYSSALYTSQILLTLHSSPLNSTSRSWTSTPITLIGYSLGGGLVADYTSYFPSSVANLFLIAPGGLIRPSHITWKSKLLYETRGVVPESLVEWMVGRRLWTGEPDADAETEYETRPMDPELELEGEAVTRADVKHENENIVRGGLRSRAVYTSSHNQLLPGNPNSTVGKVVDWQIQHHAGFVPAFVSSIRYAPIHGQQARWSKIGDFLQGSAKTAAALKEVHLILGESDPIIIAEELIPDAEDVLGKEFCKVKVYEGTGHEVAIERAEEIAGLVGGVLGL